MRSAEKCRDCGSVIPIDNPGGFCAQYLLGLAIRQPRNQAAIDSPASTSPDGLSGENQGHSPLMIEAVETPDVGAGAGPATEKPVDVVGHYRLLAEIGHGGCGVVHLAEQQVPVRRRVAVKVIKLGMDTRQVVARFEAERQALALMDHPNIAKVLDAGATDAGRPYFVMELVDGIKITEYCDQNHFGTRERLDLFIQVCRAVQHAHQKGIIHRDLKPSNILVATHDGKAVPKVIDFGIAKATQGRLTDLTFVTALDEFIGTPVYMSPEQSEFGGLDTDTRSDIYSLGVLLYEMLTSKTPFEGKELLSGGVDAMRRAIREKEPTRPSTRLAMMVPAELTTAALHRQLEPHKLVSLVSGDLDWIVMKCLEKDRARRYETANGLAVDIERYLKQEPVQARPPSGVYRARKFVRRNRLMVASSVVILAVLAVGIGGAIWQWRRAEQHANQEHLERQRAELATQLAQSAVTRMEIIEVRRAEEYYVADDRRNMLPYLALVLRQNPTHRLAAERLMSTLSHRTWARLACPPLEHSNRVTSANFSPDGTRVVTSSADNTAWVWDATTGERLAGPFTHTAEINSAKFSHDGRKLTTSSANFTARVWDVRSGEPLTIPLRHDGRVYAAEFSPDDLYVLTASGADGDCEARIWDVRDSRMVHELRHDTAVRLARFSPDGTRILTTSGLFARIWDARTGTLLGTLLHKNLVYSGRFSPDGRRVVTVFGNTDCRFQLWDASEFKVLSEPFGEGDFAEFTVDGERVLTGGGATGEVRIWDARAGQRLSERLQQGLNNKFVAMSPNGSFVLAANKLGAQIWEAPAAPLPVPDWLPELAEALGGQKFNARGQLEPLDSSGLWSVQQKIAAWAGAEVPGRGTSVDGFYARWARWFLADARTRTVFPSSTLTLPQYAMHLSGHGTIEHAAQALMLQPTNGVIMASLAVACFKPEKPLIAYADWLAQRATDLAPEQAVTWWTRAYGLAQQDLPVQALQMMARAELLTPNNPKFYNDQGMMMEQGGQWENATAAYTKSIGLTSSLPGGNEQLRTDALLARSRVLARLGRLAEARADLLAGNPNSAFEPIDLTRSYNAGFVELWHTKYIGNRAPGLDLGQALLGGVVFDVRGIIQLSSLQQRRIADTFPEKVAGLPADRICRKLHFLHATRWAMPDGTSVGHYTIHYADGEQRIIPIVYGVNLRDHTLVLDRESRLDEATEVWTQESPDRDPARMLRLFKSTWSNPRPEIKIQSLDFESAMTDCAPFLIGLTAEP